MVDEADAALRRLTEQLSRQGLEATQLIGRLNATNAAFRAAGIPDQLKKLGQLGQRLMSSSEEGIFWKAPGSGQLLVVFNSMYGDFWVSSPVLHCLLRNLGVSLLYLKDPSERRFLGGLKAFGAGLRRAGVRRPTRRQASRGPRHPRHGFLVRGYAALLAGAKLGAAGYLGLSVRTERSYWSGLPGAAPAADSDGPPPRDFLAMSSR